MPTARPRHQVTETEPVAAALDLAASEWPTEPRSRLVIKLVEEGARSLKRARAIRGQEHQDAVEATAGQFAEFYPSGYLAALRQDWPE
ncbi:MAG: hypothetical protein LBJ02_00060 [Bifidobacteriaceae bacterium]|jgi:hypothetical protein|nr:hypothetical protein [Bifidobacteriaceae bacterium]